MERGSEDLNALVAECLERMESEGSAVLEELCAEHPADAERLRRRVERLGSMGFARGAAPPERIAGFKLLRRLGEGGMGVVWLAEEEALGRTVALKLLRPDVLLSSRGRARFRREAESVARLSHEGIVPLLSAGEAEGTPWCAMEVVEGAPLHRVVHRLAERRPQDLRGADLLEAVVAECGVPPTPDARGFDGSWTEACLRVAAQVARALAHAHARGVLHRDVKPSNVMLSPGGRARLLDFGLARAEGGSELTGTGARLGSVDYMAPEVLREGGEVADARSDVHSLGVTLYELLALRSPFRADTEVATARRVQDSDAPPLRRANPAVPRDVEVVVGKAMDPDPARRYADMEAFARDLVNLLELRPVEAMAPGVLLRARRWSQRRPAAAVALASAVLFAVGVPLGVAWYERDARLAEERRAARAHADWLQADWTLDQVLHEVEREIRWLTPETRRLALEVLFAQEAYYEHFTGPTETPEEALRCGAAHARLGLMAALRGRPDGGEPRFEESVARLGRLVADDPAWREAREGLGAAWAMRARARRVARGADADVAAAFASAAEVLAPFAEDDGANEAQVLLLAEAHAQAALALLADDRRAEAADAVAAGDALERGLEGWFPGRAPVFAEVRGDLARAHEALGDPRRAEALLRRAVDARPDVGQDPIGVSPRARRARDDREVLGRLLVEDGRLDEGLAELRRAADEGERLLALLPRDATLLGELARTRSRIGEVLFALGDLPGAREQYAAAVEARLDAAAAAPRAEVHMAELVQERAGFARVLARLGELDEARAQLETAWAGREELLAICQDCAFSAGALARVADVLADLRYVEGDLDGAYEVARRGRADLVAHGGAEAGASDVAVSLMVDEAAALVGTGDPDAAEVLVEQVLDAPMDAEPTSFRRHLRAAALRLRANRAIDEGDDEGAVAALSEMVVEFDEAVARDPGDANLALQARHAAEDLCARLLRDDEAAAAAATARRLPTYLPEDPRGYRDGAWYLAYAAAFAAKDGDGATAARLADEALGVLGEALDRGYADAADLAEHPGWGPLRARPGWADLVARLDGDL